MVVNAAVQMIREAEELKQKILKFKSDTSMLHECSLWPSQQQLQKIYQKVLVLDLDYALDKKVEQDLWNVGFKQQIEALQAISKDRKNPLRSEAQAMLAWVLQAGAGFYLCLLHQICTAFKLDLPFRRRASLLGWVEGWSPGASPAAARLPPPAAARYICQHCLVHLGDLARYRQQPRVAYTFYRHALVVSTHSGQPYNQLALLARRRGRRLGALYWHVRAVLVRAPFPPAPANLRRTLQQHASGNTRPLPVLPGLRRAGPTPAAPTRLDAHGYVTEFMRALYLIHTLESLDFAASLVDTLNSSLTTLVATESFESMTLIKMVCVIIWLVHSCTEGQTVEARALSASEARGAGLAHALAAGALLALLAAAASAACSSLPAAKVCLQWVALYPQLLQTAPFAQRPQIWHALAHALNDLEPDHSDKYATVPLPEDEELHGFQPLERSMEELKFTNHAAWDTYGRRVPDEEESLPASVVSPASLNGDPKLEAAVRAHRLIELGKRLAQLRPEEFTYTVEESLVRFAALCPGGDALRAARAELAAAAPAGPDDEHESDEDAPLPAPVVISEADFREKVRDKRVGILKPQGSLERAREERALATDDQEQDECCDDFRGEDRREARRPRVNIAMAAILRKQEETSKQVKFRTPPPVAEETEAETNTAETSLASPPAPQKPKSTLPRPQKSLANIPVGRKTGGILALKDKSGYPHLVNVAEDPTPRQTEKPVLKDPKVIQPPTHLPKRDAPAPKWHQPLEGRPGQRMYGLQNAGIAYNPNYEAPATLTSQNIRLSVVNPKEIDVRSAALQKQNSRTDFQHRSANFTGDKKLFMDDLPPRFAQQRWSEADNKFKICEESKENKMNPDLFNTPPPTWLSPLSSQTQARMSIPPPSRMTGPPPSQLSGASQLSMPPPAVQMSIPSASQMSVPPPPLQDSYQWWNRTQMYGQLSSSQAQSQALQQLYSSQLSYNLSPYGQMSTLDSMVPPSFLRQSPIGQLPTRHVSPPTYNPYPTLSYPGPFEAYPQYQSRGFLEETRYAPPSPEALDLRMSPEARAVKNLRERAEDDARIADAMLDSSPLDLSRRDDPESDASAEDPGTYSLFSGAPGAWGQVGQAQQPLPAPGVLEEWEDLHKRALGRDGTLAAAAPRPPPAPAPRPPPAPAPRARASFAVGACAAHPRCIRTHDDCTPSPLYLSRDGRYTW